MNLIHGILSLDGRDVNNDWLHRMFHSVKTLGPDGGQCQSLGKIALASSLLKTLPEHRFERHAILHGASQNVYLVADARIDNREELFQLLELDEQQNQSISDHQLIVLAYARWKKDCAEKLIGDYAFALWDAVSEELFCCRDIFGVRPFYYYHSEQYFIFSSDLQAFSELDVVPKILDEYYLADKIGGLRLRNNRTRYQAIKTLSAAHTLNVSDQQFNLQCYWQPDLTQQIVYSNEQEYVDEYLKLFLQAVHCRLASDHGISSYISGGLDSSSIASVADAMLKKQGRALSAFCHVLPADQSNPEEDEKALVQLLVQKNGIDVAWVSNDQFDREAITHWKQQYQMDIGEFKFTSLLGAKQCGSRVHLNGGGGDQVATTEGYGLYEYMIRHLDWRGLYKQIKSLDGQRSMPRKFLSVLKNHWPWTVPGHTRRAVHQHLFETCCFNADFVKQADLVKLAEQSSRFSIERKSFQASLLHTLTHGRQAHDKNAQQHYRMQIEPRYPMLDRRLIEYCLAIPLEQHRLGGQRRRLIRQAMKKYLPDEIRLRHDKTFSSNPGAQSYIHKNVAEHYQVIKQAGEYPQIKRLIALDKLQKRLDELAGLIHNQQYRRFKMASTMRSIAVIRLILQELKGGS